MCFGLNITDSVSLTLGIGSAVLGLVAICQAAFYKREQERQALIQEAFLKEQRINLTYACIRNRIMYRQVCRKGIVSLRKDRALIYATSAFYSSHISENIDEIESLLRRALKNCYTSGIVDELKRSDIHQGDFIYEAFLRSESDTDYLKNIIAVNDELEKYGLYLSLMVE